MKTNLLTQIELATLAANLPTGTAKERVELAMAIWVEAEAHLLNEEVLISLERNNAEWDEIWNERPRPLSQLLTEIIPNKRADARIKLWREFIHSDPLDLYGPDYSKDVRENLLEVQVLEHCKNGVTQPQVMVAEFKDWQKRRVIREREEKTVAAKAKASKASKSRWDKTPESKRIEGKAGGKTQQIKKRAKSRK